MVLRLAVALDMPLRQPNELLLRRATPRNGARPTRRRGAAPIHSAFDHMLSQQEPFPAVVVDRRWNLLQANTGAVAMVEFLVGPPARQLHQPRRCPGDARTR